MEEPKAQTPQPPAVNSAELPDDMSRDAVAPPPKPKRNKWLWLGLGLAVLAAGAAYWFVTKDEPKESITSYEECVAAGYPVMESYPEQCAVPGGQTFTRQLSEEEQAALENENSDFDAASPLVTDLGDDFVRLVNVGDEKKLPSITPASFVEFMASELAANNPSENGCVSLTVVNVISEVNIRGSVGSVKATTLEEGEGCAGGAAKFWYLKDGKWASLGLQGSLNCETLSGTTIYSEFLPTCYDEKLDEMDGSEAYGQRPNPNGSIDDAEL